MHKFILFIKEFHIYKKTEILDAISSFSKKQFIIFIGLLVIAFISILVLFYKINDMFMVSVPINGGTLTEGILGSPTLINPVIAISEADKDITSLVYSGLMRKTPDGNFITDLAESYTISPDGKSYTFILKEDIRFHNNTKVTADDVVFTIEKIKNPTIKSPRSTDWDGVSISKIDDRTVVFNLQEPYISFLDNTTIGILSSSLWKNISESEFNISPLNNIKAIGTGPYKIKSVSKDSDGIPTSYKLDRYKNFSITEPFIKSINIISYTNEKELVKALLSHSIDQACGISPENIENIKNKNYKIDTANLPKIFGIFFNSNNNKIFADQEIVKIINKSIDRKNIIDQVLNGYGNPIYNPIPEEITPNTTKPFSTNTIDEVNASLDKLGWVKGDDGIRAKGGGTKTITKKVGKKTVTQTVKDTSPKTRLSFSLTTGDTPELIKVTEIIKEQLLKVGIEVDITKVYETGQLNQLIIDRQYEALFLGQNLNHESGLYSFWHSSQRLSPGRNIAMYNNKKVDDLLSSIQKTLKIEDRIPKYESLYKEFNINIPAILIYSPKYIQVSSSNLNNIYLKKITFPSDRFSSVYQWSTDIDKVWKIFTK